MADYGEPIADSEKVEIATNFIKHAPPGEFNEVFNDVRILLNNDNLLKEQASAFAQYNTEQFLPAELNEGGTNVLITKHGHVSGSTFYDPKSHKQFNFDHLRKKVSDIEDYSPDSAAESWREPVDTALRTYCKQHYPHGSMSVYGKSEGSDIKLVVCIEDHQFEPKNFWNGRWRSEWTITFPSSGGSVKVTGLFKVQVHYYEDGNVQLVSHKDVEHDIDANDGESMGKKLASIIENDESEYQQAIGENYHAMSGTTFKALRRALPVTRSLIDWNKIVSYKLGSELQK